MGPNHGQMLRRVPIVASPWAPALHKAPVHAWRPPSMGRKHIGQGNDVVVSGIGAIPMLISATVGAGVAWVGFSTGSRESGLLSVLGYIFGIGGAISAVGGTIGALLLVAESATAPLRTPDPDVSMGR